MTVLPSEAQPPLPPAAGAPRRARWKSRLKFLVILLLITELALRWIFGLGTPVVYTTDAACGYFPTPNQDVRRFFAHNKINAFGMRSEDVPAKKDPTHFRLLLIGDSMAYGTTYVDQSKIFASILARELPAITHKPTDVLNAATGAWSTFNECGYLESRGTFDADLVVFVMNCGDFTQPMHFLAPDEQRDYPLSRPWTAIGETFSRYVWPRIFRYAASKPDAGLVREETPDVEHEMPKMLAELTRARAFCEAHQARMGILFFGVQEPSPYYPGLKLLREWSAASQTPLVDVGPDLAAFPDNDVFYNGHFRPRGNEVVARAFEREWAAFFPTPVPALTPAPSGTSQPAAAR